MVYFIEIKFEVQIIKCIVLLYYDCRRGPDFNYPYRYSLILLFHIGASGGTFY